MVGNRLDHREFNELVEKRSNRLNGTANLDSPLKKRIRRSGMS